MTGDETLAIRLAITIQPAFVLFTRMHSDVNEISSSRE